MKTLREVSEIVGMTRRMIQEYENYEGYNLATTPTTKNKYGYLLYDDKDIERLWMIRFYRELKYKKKQIAEVFSNPDYNMKEELEKIILSLEEEREKLDNLIKTAKAMHELDINPISLKFMSACMGNTSFDDTVAIFIAGSQIYGDPNVTEDMYVDILTEEDYDEIYDIEDKVAELRECGYSYDDMVVQEKVREIYKIQSKGFAGSVMYFSYYSMIFTPGTESATSDDKIYGVGYSEYMYRAIHFFCMNNSDNEFDKPLLTALDNIEKLARNHFSFMSVEVQNEVKEIHNYYLKMKGLSEEGQLESVAYIGKIFSSDAIKKIVDNGAEKGLSWFLSRAIEIYIEKNKG